MGGTFNKDKSTANKAFRYRHAALEILRAPDAEHKWFFKALGIQRDVQQVWNDAGVTNKRQAILKLIVASLKAR